MSAYYTWNAYYRDGDSVNVAVDDGNTSLDTIRDKNVLFIIFTPKPEYQATHKEILLDAEYAQMWLAYTIRDMMSDLETGKAEVVNEWDVLGLDTGATPVRLMVYKDGSLCLTTRTEPR